MNKGLLKDQIWDILDKNWEKVFYNQELWNAWIKLAEADKNLGDIFEV